MAQPPLLREEGEYACQTVCSILDSSALGRRGNEPRNEASGVVLKKRERSEPPYIFA